MGDHVVDVMSADVVSAKVKSTAGDIQASRWHLLYGTNSTVALA